MTSKQLVMMQGMVQGIVQRSCVIESQGRCNIRRIGLLGMVKQMVQQMVKIFSARKEVQEVEQVVMVEGRNLLVTGLLVHDV